MPAVQMRIQNVSWIMGRHALRAWNVVMKISNLTRIAMTDSDMPGIMFMVNLEVMYM